jgi:hypothetical protein
MCAALHDELCCSLSAAMFSAVRGMLLLLLLLLKDSGCLQLLHPVHGVHTVTSCC